MSDDEGSKKQTGYRLEYAPSNRAKCSGPKPCSGSPITKGELRLGTLIEYNGNRSFKWRHWGCTTARILSNFKNQFDDADGLDGFEELNHEDQERVRKAWAEGHVADEDIPATARKDDDEAGGTGSKKKATKRKKDADDANEPEEEDKPKKKRAPAKAKAGDTAAEDEEKPKRKRGPAKKAAANEEAEETEEQPKKRTAAKKTSEPAAKAKPVKKAAAKKGKAKTKTD
ncbi:unnamed protein product, partial [Rhizoctonia solani]